LSDQSGGHVDELVHLEVDDAVATVTLDSPANRNALGSALTGQLRAALDTAAGDDSVRVVLLRSAGPVFCSGADMREAVEVGMHAVARDMVAVQRTIVALPRPVVVRLDGPFALEDSAWWARPTWCWRPTR
jgi:enoyl-CoA hydratase/methylglutaconyl-CoA hydratase